MSKKIIKDIFLKQKKKEVVSLGEELKMEKKKRGKLFLRVFIFLAAAVLAASFGYISISKTSSAVVSITPYQSKIEADSLLKAENRSVSEASESEGLFFETIKMEIEESETVIPTGISAGGKKADGTITIYNNYDSVPQKLVASTRFESPEGKIYRIQKAVTVPGMGSIDAIVYADQPGEDYNIVEGTDFKIPGLKGGPRYEKFFAKSKTSIIGGSSGNAKTVKKEDLDGARKSINEKIKKRLIDYFYKQKPDGYILYPGAVKVEYPPGNESGPKIGDAAGAGEILTMKIKGNATGYILKKSELSKSLFNSNARKIVKSYEPSGVLVDNLENLTFSLLSVDAKANQIKISLKGESRFVWNVDTDKLISELMKEKNKNYLSVFKNYAGIEEAFIAYSPSWWRSLPKNKDKIKVNLIINK